MILGLDGTAILVSSISTLGVLGVGIIGYFGIKAQLVRSTEMNTSQHGEVASAVVSMESTLKDVDATLSLLVSTQGFPVFKNTAEGHLIWANPAALELIGLPFDELADSHKWVEAIHIEDRDIVYRNWREQIDSGRPTPVIRYRYVHPITSRVTAVRAMSRPIFNKDGSIREWVSMIVPVETSEVSDE